MNFDELYKKYKNNSATDEEREYVEAEIEKAKKVSRILNNDEPEGEEKTVKLSDIDVIKKAKKKFNNKNTIKTIIIVCISLLVIGALTAGGIAATIFISANKSMTVTEKEAIEIARNIVAEHEGIENTDSIVVGDVDTDLEIRSNLVDSYFKYEINVACDGYGYEVVINANSGFASISGNHYRSRHDRYDDHHDFDYDDRYDDFDDRYDD